MNALGETPTPTPTPTPRNGDFEVTMYANDGECAATQFMAVSAMSGDCQPMDACMTGMEMFLTQKCGVFDYKKAGLLAFHDARHVIVDNFDSTCSTWSSAFAVPADGVCHGHRGRKTFIRASVTDNSVVVAIFRDACLSNVTAVINASLDGRPSNSCVEGRRVTVAGTDVPNAITATPVPRSSDHREVPNAPLTSSTATSTGIDWTTVVIIAIATVAVAFLITTGFKLWRQRRNQAKEAPNDITTNDNERIQRFLPSLPTVSGNNEVVFFARDPDLRQLRCPMQDIQRDSVLGAGGLCVVWRVRIQGSSVRALKRLKEPSPTRGQVTAFVEEIKLTAKLRHPRIVALVGVAWTKSVDLQALFEYMEGGSLRSWLQTTSNHGWTSEKMQMAIDVVDALAYVHAFMPPIVHRDIKSSNVLLEKQMRAKLSDFGCARFRSYEATMTAGVGSFLWLSPEIVLGKRDYDQRCDIFAFGVLLSELDTHKLPYHDFLHDSGGARSELSVIHRVGTGEITPSFSETCPPELQQLAQRCLAFEPRDRPMADEIFHCLTKINREVISK